MGLNCRSASKTVAKLESISLKGDCKMKPTTLKTVILIVLFLSLASYGGTYSGGDGNDVSPYQINEPSDWLELMADANDWDKHFILTSDIDMEGIEMTPVGNESTNFTGVLTETNIS